MKILVLSNVFPPGFIGGYELGAHEVTEYLSRQGHEITVLSSDYFLDDENQISNYQVKRVLDCAALSHALLTEDVTQNAVFVNWRNIRIISSEIRRMTPDLVLCFNIGALGQFGIVALLRHLRIPTLYYFMDAIFDAVDVNHPHLQHFTHVFGENNLGAQASAVFMSKNLEKQVRPRIGPVLDEEYYIPGWIPDSLFDEDYSGSRKSPDRRRFVFCSRVAPHKGTEVMIDAVKILSEENLPEFDIDVFGMGQVTQFMQRCATLGVSRYIRYCGALDKDQMLSKFGEYHALLFPTWPREPYGFVASEAAAVGCVPVMTRGIGAAEWFLDGIDSLKIDRDPHSLANAMRSVLLMPQDKLHQMAVNCVRNARTNLVMSRWMAEIESLVHRHVDRHKGALNPDMYGVQGAILALAELWKERCRA